MSIEPLPSNPTPATKSSETSASPVLGSSAGQEGKGAKAAKDFGPDYVLDKSYPSNEVAGGVPFAPDTPAQTLAALPPIHPLGTASLTELSLQKMMQVKHKSQS